MGQILVTGGTGYIGSALIEKLRFKNHIHVLTRRIPAFIPEGVEFHLYDGKASSVHAVFSKAPIEAVIHLASKAQYSATEQEIPEFIGTNIEFATLLLEVMSTHGCRKFINTSTYWQEFQSDKPVPTCLYAATKSAFEKILDFYVFERSLSVISLRLFDVYGPRDHRSKVFKQLKDAARAGRRMEMTPGEQRICFSHIDDVCRAYEQALNLLAGRSTTEHRRFDVIGFTHTLKDAMQRFCEIQGIRVDISWGAVPYRETQIMDPVLFEPVPGWKPLIDIQEGFKEV